MELLIELIIEFVAEGLFWGIEEGMESKKVPMPLRILAAVVLFTLVIGVGAIFVFLGLTNGSIVFRILLGVVFVGLLVGMTWKVCKVFRKKRDCV